MTTRGVTIKAMIDAENLYVLATRSDATQSVAKDSWIFDGNLEAGRHKVDFDASNLSSGIYLYRLSINGFTDMKKMAFIK